MFEVFDVSELVLGVGLEMGNEVGQVFQFFWIFIYEVNGDIDKIGVLVFVYGL